MRFLTMAIFTASSVLLSQGLLTTPTFAQEPACELFGNWHYGGASLKLKDGQCIANLGAVGFNDVASSAKVRKGCNLVTFQDAGFVGCPRPYNESSEQFGKTASSTFCASAYADGPAGRIKRENDNASSAKCWCGDKASQNMPKTGISDCIIPKPISCAGYPRNDTISYHRINGKLLTYTECLHTCDKETGKITTTNKCETKIPPPSRRKDGKIIQ